MNYWLVKSEPSCYSIDDLARDKRTLWTEVRNYQARNYLKQMGLGDEVLVYHSNDEPIGVVGVAEVAGSAVPDPTQFDPRNDHFDPQAKRDSPRWFSPELKFRRRFNRIISRVELKSTPGLSKLILLQRGSRLSVQPVTAREYEIITRLSRD